MTAMPTQTLPGSPDAKTLKGGRGFGPQGAMHDVLACNDDEILVEGAAGTGKTRAVLEKLHLICKQGPGVRILIVRKERKALSETVLVTFEDEVLPLGHAALAGPSRQFRGVYNYPNGSSIVLGGMDRAEKVMSSQYDVIYAPEATELTENDWEMLSTRLRNGVLGYQQGICDCNPAGPSHWLNVRARQNKMTRIRTTHHDNPRYYANGKWTVEGKRYQRKLEKLTGARRKRLLEGKWAQAEGAVYPLFDPDIHVIDGYEWHDASRIVASKDWGYRDPGVTQIWAVDGDHRLILIDELYMTGKTIDWWIREDRLLADKYNVASWFADPSEPGYIEQYGQAGMMVIKAENDISLGLRLVEQRLTLQRDGRPRMLFCRAALSQLDPELLEAKQPTCTVQEFESYVYPPQVEGKPTKEEPMDTYNHGMDCLRYISCATDRHSEIPADLPPMGGWYE